MVNILIFGLPGSGKTTLANKLAKKIGATHLNADETITNISATKIRKEMGLV